MIYAGNKPRVTNSVVNLGFTGVMAKTFGEQLRQRLTEASLTAAELSRRSGVTKQNIGRLLNNTPHSITGAPPKVEVETVEKLAGPLGWNLNEALVAAGYAPADIDPEGLYSGINKLPPALRPLAIRQAKAVIESLSTEEHDTNYIEDTEE